MITALIVTLIAIGAAGLILANDRVRRRRLAQRYSFGEAGYRVEGGRLRGYGLFAEQPSAILVRPDKLRDARQILQAHYRK